MFDSDYTICGKHAKFLKFLARKNSESERVFGAKVFDRYIDVYMNAAIFGLIYSRRIKRDTESDDRADTAHILANAFSRERDNCIFLYRIVLLLDESSKLTAEEKISRAFNNDSQAVQNNLELFNDYVRGGIEFLYEKFNDGCRTPDDFLNKTYEFVEEFQKDLSGISDQDISKLLTG